ncbi:conserved Plasmodium protein, unknown function [Plasmodium knowlesi strain H]|uniref:Plasmodium RESA N-terminal domain-containing protein n=2 Tax=Plasmodium knowlesi (strain H) TaxID=5851 RepID=A0A5K1UQ08_PLAKH|nr:conserved Plasmodium protein, unknown function [Plasmodium knowlesi strain H]CAA9986422.1 conserved Plasmodium protein, unknown function [Plasmodium knowlesi strain H]SBO27173.1 conserved Plasmodium protein, unknown function [Plasmodium knowlesi strain H]SBO29557.1 conserved Plasmodium protein, unknown function [Plasmodium knowlesi strain H]VVS75896.1 conserved Plasmodium protein, unknown function [Plasmodium knowlesi strain H]|eukprot:XP_002257827.1 hypothetical protein, conserved in Plasmodium species [Plasmodium knowlesi strain H]
MTIWNIFSIFLYHLVFSSFFPCTTTKGERLSGLPLSQENINKILSINHIDKFENFDTYLKFIKFKYEMVHLANEHFKKINSPEIQLLLNSKDILVKVLNENAERNKIKISKEYIEDTAEYILDELHKKNEVKKIEQVVHDEYCDSYRTEYYEYRDRQFNAAFENAHSNWAHNELTKNFDPQWKKVKWNLWVDYFNDILYTLKIKDYMLHVSILHLRTISSSCKEIYDTLKASLIQTYKDPFKQEYFKFLDSSVEEWEKLKEK